MRFTRLRLNGFKSFVDSTELVIRDGLTGIVGPNGCGKSNLLEALRWVMGENRPTIMRGAGMADVIFAGTTTRLARHFAEVALLIDNHARLAPAEFNHDDVIEVVRRITRDAGSAYKINQKEARARDVQMLFADAASGAHSPALVRQGQISELINAKPKARRRILEDAAGIAGLYQRRHEAELRLNGAEQNLARVQDVIGQLLGQLGALTRQARQAARYREIGQELRLKEAMLFHQRGLAAYQAGEEAQKALDQAIMAAIQAEKNALLGGELRRQQDETLVALRDEQMIASALLHRLEGQNNLLQAEKDRMAQNITALQARLEQVGFDLQREKDLCHDAAQTILQLQEEEARLRQDHQGHDDLLQDAQAALQHSTQRLAESEAAFAAHGEAVGALIGRHESAQRMAQDAQAVHARLQADSAQTQQDFAAAQAAYHRAMDQCAKAREACEQAEAAREQADEALCQSEDRLLAAQENEAGARTDHRAYEGDYKALAAEHQFLERLLAQDRPDQGQVLDLIAVQAGYEAALGAALAHDLRAPLGDHGSGWHRLPDYDSPPALPEGAAPLALYVTAPDALRRRLAQVGVVMQGAEMQAQLAPGQCLVNLAGDVWRWDGLRRLAADAPSPEAERLVRRNRMVGMAEELAALAQNLAAAQTLWHKAQADMARAVQDEQAARTARRLAEQHLVQAHRAVTAAEADSKIAGAQQEALQRAKARLEDEAITAGRRMQEAALVLSRLPALEESRDRLDRLKTALEAARIAMMSKRAEADELAHQGRDRTARLQKLVQEQGHWQKRLHMAQMRVDDLNDQRQMMDEELQEALDRPEALAQQQEDILVSLDGAKERHYQAQHSLQEAEARLAVLQTAERDSERAAGMAREARAIAQTRLEAQREALHQVQGQMMERLEMTPAQLAQQLEGHLDAMPPLAQLESDVARLKEQRESLGAVNLRAEEDARALQAEHDGLAAERHDLEEGIKKLRSAIADLNREGRGRLLAAFEEVNRSFTALFTHLFGGGEARLILVESDDPLEAGLEILCQPPGKKLSSLSLLSGGEQTLTALALIFAVFLANPAPICVLDEVDAPLDDANVTRFCDLLDEMTRRTQTRFLVITHHSVTMARMDRLFGVTMVEKGVSQLVSVDLSKAAAMVG